MIEASAAAEHLTLEQFLHKLVHKHLEDKSWQELIQRGRRQSQDLGYTEDDVDRLIHEHRNEKRRRSR